MEESCTTKPPPVSKKEKEKTAPTPATSPVEIATIAVTEDVNTDSEEFQIPDVPDDPLPDILIKPEPILEGFKVLHIKTESPYDNDNNVHCTVPCNESHKVCSPNEEKEILHLYLAERLS